MKLKQLAALTAVIAGLSYALARYYWAGWNAGYIVATGWPLTEDDDQV